jgi:succinate dehydrogenase / fumarate reductase cytochrome b subunit
MSQTMARSAKQRVQPIRKRRKQLPFPLNLYQTAIGKKWVMALTGIGLLGFVIAHMLGNLHLYEGPVQINVYGEHLRTLLTPMFPRTMVLWLLRLGLAGMFFLHIHAAVSLTRMNLQSNKRYASSRDYIAVNFASRTMRWTGLIIGLYVLFHLADLTWGWWLGSDYVRGDVYHNVTQSLSNIPVGIIYVVANVALAVHIFHGVYSLFQSLGINTPAINKARRGLATSIAGLILIGNLSFPVLVMVGFVNEDNCHRPTDVEHAELAVCGTHSDTAAGGEVHK